MDKENEEFYRGLSGVVVGLHSFCGINKVDFKTLLSTLFD